MRCAVANGSKQFQPSRIANTDRPRRAPDGGERHQHAAGLTSSGSPNAAHHASATRFSDMPSNFRRRTVSDRPKVADICRHETCQDSVSWCHVRHRETVKYTLKTLLFIAYRRGIEKCRNRFRFPVGSPTLPSLLCPAHHRSNILTVLTF
jgi:hypothetical protein